MPDEREELEEAAEGVVCSRCGWPVELCQCDCDPPDW